MGKRSNVAPRSPRDYYPTVDPSAVDGLFKLVAKGSTFAEPCVGQRHLVKLLEKNGVYCRYQGDIAEGKDATKLTREDIDGSNYIITNPPFSWPLLQPLLDHLPTIAPTVLLLPADVMHNIRMAPYMKKCSGIASIGRLYWVEDKPIKGVDNYAWFMFHDYEVDTKFYGR